MKIFHINRAFSLVEMMVSLIAVSVLIAAFVPVITKRAKPSILTASSSSGFKTNCSEAFSEDCILCDGNKKCYICNKICTSDNYKDSSACACKPCSSIDPNCTSCSGSGTCNTCADELLLQDNACIPCPDGFICSDGIGTPCPEGYYCKNSIKTPCDPGKWSTSGSSSCTPCPEGSYCKDGIKTSCAPGKWSTAGRSTECTDDCPAGYACKDGVKIQCDPGTYSTTGASTCTTCEEGYYCTGGSRTPCADGKWSTTGRSTACTDNCPTGFICSNGEQTADSCVAGQYEKKDGSCASCETGYYCPDGTSRYYCSSKTPGCRKCDTKTGECIECWYGEFWNGTICCPKYCSKCSTRIPEDCDECEDGYVGVSGSGTYGTMCVPPCPSGYVHDYSRHCKIAGTYTGEYFLSGSTHRCMVEGIPSCRYEFSSFGESWECGDGSVNSICNDEDGYGYDYGTTCPDRTEGATCYHVEEDEY